MRSFLHEQHNSTDAGGTSCHAAGRQAGVFPPGTETTGVPACVQDSANALLQLYMMHLIDSGQHQLLPVYACHMRADIRHEVGMQQHLRCLLPLCPLYTSGLCRSGLLHVSKYVVFFISVTRQHALSMHPNAGRVRPHFWT